jgi:parallel beta-helix repeat protein
MLSLAVRGDRSLRVRLVVAVAAAVALVILVVRPASAVPTILYVDGGNPSCSDTGAGTESVPFCTIKKGATVAVAGQTVQVASGTYPELVTLGHSGSPGSPIVLTAAPGANVIVSGMANGFKVSARSYVTIHGFTVTDTTSYGIYVASSSSNVTISDNHVSGTASHGIYLTSLSTDVTVTGNTVSGATGYGIYVNTLSNITVSGNTVSDTTSYGIHVNSSSNVTVSDNDVSGAGERVQGSTKYGIKLAATTDSLVSDNVSHDNSEAGVFLDADTNEVEVTGNHTFGNARGYARAAPGIDVRGFNNTIDRNVSHDNEDSGLQFYTGSHDNLVVGNLSYFNGDHGIDDLGATGQRIIGNTIWWNYTAGINLEGSSTGATVQNNVSVDNGYNISPCITPPAGAPDCADEHRTRGNIRVDATSTTGATVDYNLVFLTDPPDTMYVWGKKSYTSLSLFQAATGQEAHGIEADPEWVTAGSNFHLESDSPAIDSANSGVSGETSTDLEGHDRVDDPGTANTGDGPRTYDDRGALEFQP